MSLSPRSTSHSFGPAHFSTLPASSSYSPDRGRARYRVLGSSPCKSSPSPTGPAPVEEVAAQDEYDDDDLIFEMDDDFSSSSRRPSTSTTASGSSDHSSSGPSSPASFAELHLFNLDDADFHMDGSGISGVLADDLDFEADVPTPKVTYSRHRRQTSPTLADMLSAEVWAEHEKGGEPAVQDWVSSRFATLVTFLCEADTLTGRGQAENDACTSLLNLFHIELKVSTAHLLPQIRRLRGQLYWCNHVGSRSADEW